MSLRKGDHIISGRSQAFNPIVSAEKIDNGNIISIQDKNKTIQFTVLNGTNGKDGASNALDINPCEVTFNSDGSITETYQGGYKTTVFNEDGTIIETIYKDGISISQKTIFNADGSISIVEI